MTMVENELLRGERAHAVAQQNVGLAWVLVFRDDSKRNHVFDELIKTAGSKVAKAAEGLCGQAMTPVIISVNDKVCAHEYFSKFRISGDVLAESMGDLNDAANLVMTAPFHARNAKAVSACELESLWFSLGHRSPS